MDVYCKYYNPIDTVIYFRTITSHPASFTSPTVSPEASESHNVAVTPTPPIEPTPSISQISTTAKAPRKRRGDDTTSNPLIDSVLSQVNTTSNVLKEVLQGSTMQTNNDRDQKFADFIASELRQLPEGPTKDYLKLTLQQKIVEAKHQTATQSSSSEEANQFSYARYLCN